MTIGDQFAQVYDRLSKLERRMWPFGDVSSKGVAERLQLDNYVDLTLLRGRLVKWIERNIEATAVSNLELANLAIDAWEKATQTPGPDTKSLSTHLRGLAERHGWRVESTFGDSYLFLVKQHGEDQRPDQRDTFSIYLDVDEVIYYVCYSAGTGRITLPHRSAILAEVQELITK